MIYSHKHFYLLLYNGLLRPFTFQVLGGIDYIVGYLYTLFMPPNFEKVRSILVSAGPSMHQKKIKARILKFHIWIPHQK